MGDHVAESLLGTGSAPDSHAFPKLHLLAVAPISTANPPRPLSPFVGRERELAAICDRLLLPSVSILTLTGPGGVGKTRLAIEAANRLQSAFEAIAYVDLAPVRDPALVLPTIARRLGLRENGVDLIERLHPILRSRRILLVLDNFEQIVAAGPTVSALAAEFPELKQLVTSRVVLRVAGERAFSVAPLGLPEPSPAPDHGSLESEAVHLFVERAQSIDQEFTMSPANVASVVAICHHLDGLPLAIELAAARVKLFSPAALHARLERRLPILTGGPHDAPARQRTMRDAIAWSYDLLSNNEQALFRRLGVFVGGFTLEAAEYVGGEGFDSIALLIEHSLLSKVEGTGDEPRFGMLETVREFSLEVLADSGEEAATRWRHLNWCLALAEEAAPQLHGLDQATWFARLESEHGNVRAALAWATDTGRGSPTERATDAAATAALALRLAGALWWLWYHRGFLSEGRQWLALALAKTPDAPGPERATAYLGSGMLALYQGDEQAAAAHLVDALARFRALGDDRGIALTLFVLGVGAEDRGDYDGATALFAEALPRFAEPEDGSFIALTQYHLGVVAYGLGDLERAEALLDEAHELASAAGGEAGAVGALSYLGLVRCDQGDHTGAFDALRASLAADWANGHQIGIARGLANLATLAQVRGEPTLAARLFGAVGAFAAVTGYAFGQPERARYERAAHEANLALGEAAFIAAQDAGRALPLEQVIAQAIEEPDTAPTAANIGAAELAGLTAREVDVLRLLVEGCSDKEIGEALFISHRTAMWHVSNILGKLAAPTRTAATSYAVREGLV
jgi:predicted ATPase/DNA-binding CsgD family transcriptional regulator